MVVPIGGRCRWIVKGIDSRVGLVLISIITSGCLIVGGGVLDNSKDPGDRSFVLGNVVLTSSNLAAVECLTIFVEGSNHRIRRRDLVNPMKYPCWTRDSDLVGDGTRTYTVQPHTRR